MPPTGAFIRPDEATVVQRLEIVGERHPGIGRLCGDDARGPGRRIDAQQIQRPLVARLALDVKHAAVRSPVDARQIDVGVVAEVDLDPPPRPHVVHPQLDQGVWPSRAGIALLDRGRPAARDVQPRNDVDRALVGPLQGDEALVRAPPVAGVTIHLLLGDELGRGPADQAGAVRRDWLLLPVGQVDDDQVLIAHEADEAALRTDLGVDLVGLGLGQATDVAAFAAGQEDVALQRRQDVPALLIPRILDHAALADPHPLATRLFGLRQFAGVGNQRAGVDQLERLPLPGRRGPQVQHRDIVLPCP